MNAGCCVDRLLIDSSLGEPRAILTACYKLCTWHQSFEVAFTVYRMRSCTLRYAGIVFDLRSLMIRLHIPGVCTRRRREAKTESREEVRERREENCRCEKGKRWHCVYADWTDWLGPQIKQTAVGELSSMGFGQDVIVRALLKHNNNMENAVAALLNAEFDSVGRITTTSKITTQPPPFIFIHCRDSSLPFPLLWFLCCFVCVFPSLFFFPVQTFHAVRFLAYVSTV